MDIGLNGKRALVTGATRGIGRAIAETFLAEGASVALCARSEESVIAAVQEMSQSGKVVGAAVDAGDISSLESWVSSSAEQLGGIDIYVHNTSAKPQAALEDWIKNFEVDLRSLVAGVSAATDALVDGGGALVSIGTTAVAEHFGSGAGSYSAFKAAATNWTLGQAQILGARGVRCNVVSPGPTWVDGGDWNMIADHMPEFYETVKKGHPSGEIGTVRDIANAVAFLCGDISAHVNGANLTVDGGFLKRVDY